MWTRAELKERAKNVLRGSYWKAFLVSIILALTSGQVNYSGSSFRNDLGNSPFNPNSINSNSYQQMFSKLFFSATALSIFVVTCMVVFGIRIFLGYELEVGGRKYFIKAAENDVNLSYLGHGFSDGRYIEIMKSMLWRTVINFLWYLLLYIPGIIKKYAYSMVPFILADNPKIGYRRALELSEQMTNGQKMDMFVLDLSFILWFLLGLCCCCIGLYFVFPYYNSTYAELYLVLRQNALDNNLCTYDELCLDDVTKYNNY